jgi:hypothetical protein
MKSTAIVSLFLERKDRFGCAGLSRKQVAWLGDQLGKEHGAELFRDKHHPITVWDASGNAYHFVIYPQGGGLIKPMPVDSLTGMTDETKKKSLEAAAKLREAGHAWAADEIEKALKNA